MASVRFAIIMFAAMADVLCCDLVDASSPKGFSGPTCEELNPTDWLVRPPPSFKGEMVDPKLVLVVRQNVSKAASLLARKSVVRIGETDVVAWTGSPSPIHSEDLHPYLVRAIDKGPSSALEVRTKDNKLLVFTFSLGCAHNLKTPIIVFLRSKPGSVFVQAGGAM